MNPLRLRSLPFNQDVKETDHVLGDLPSVLLC